LPAALKLVDQEKYFSLRAPRQSGKTTLIQNLVNLINEEGRYYAFNCSLAPLWGLTDRQKALTELAALINSALAASPLTALKLKAYVYNSQPGSVSASSIVKTLLNGLCEDLTKDLVIFFDEVDSLAWSGLSPFLAQLKEGYQSRHLPGLKFPRSLILVGQRDLEDCLAEAPAETKSTDAPRPPLNVPTISLALANFSFEDLSNLYGQHTAETGQVFTPEALTATYNWSQGQPWLVNALARQVVDEVLNHDYEREITSAHFDEAAFALIDHHDAPIQFLLERLKEPRVITVLDPLLVGSPRQVFLNDHDRGHCLSLGLMAQDSGGGLKFANPITREVIFRLLADQIQASLDNEYALIPWRNETTLLLSEILTNFQAYWRDKGAGVALKTDRLDLVASDILKKELAQLLDAEISNDLLYQYIIARINDLLIREYDESLPALTLLAFLRKIIATGARFLVDCHEGRGGIETRLFFEGGPYVMEITRKPRSTLERSLDRLKASLTQTNSKTGWLVIFDPDRALSWDEKIYNRTQTDGDLTFNVFGC
jgi:hypothetical protein